MAAIHGSSGLRRDEQLHRARLGVRVSSTVFAVALLAGVVWASFGCREQQSQSPAVVCRRQLQLKPRSPESRRLPALTASKCRMTFTQVREERRQCAYGCCKCVQLAEVAIFGVDPTGRHVRMNVSSIANPGGRSPPGQGPGSAVDGDMHTKWIDMALPEGFAPGPFGSSVLEMTLATEGTPLSYSFTVANDAEWRDPVGWQVRCWSSDGAEFMDTVPTIAAPHGIPIQPVDFSTAQHRTLPLAILSGSSPLPCPSPTCPSPTCPSPTCPSPTCRLRLEAPVPNLPSIRSIRSVRALGLLPALSTPAVATDKRAATALGTTATRNLGRPASAKRRASGCGYPADIPRAYSAAASVR